jgi:UDP-N-acetylmuramate dehydrogenase
LSYRDLQNQFVGGNPTLESIRETIIKIRNQKYPYPTNAKNGNAGSFFKNPILSEPAYKNLKNRIGKIYSTNLSKKIFIDKAGIKIPAAFLMEICGLKNLKVGGAKINENQPLVIVNENGNATAQDVLHLAKEVIKTVHARVGIKLTIEPELVGFQLK